MDDTNIINIQEFDMQFKPGSVIVLLGARGTGKTTLAMSCLYHMRHYPLGLIMAGTFDTIEEYSEVLPHTLIYEKYMPSKVAGMIAIQTKKLRSIVAANPGRSIERNKAALPPVFLVLDDLMHDYQRINKDKAFAELMYAGRHHKITLVICAQYVMHIAKAVRGQIDFVFTTYQQDPAQRKLIMEQFNVGFPSLNSFHILMQKCTEDYRTMVMAMHTNERDISRRVFYYKAPLNRKFRMGSKALWDIHRRRFNPRYYSEPADNSKKRFVVRRVPRKRKFMV